MQCNVNVSFECKDNSFIVKMNGVDISKHVKYIKFEQSVDECNQLILGLNAVNFKLNKETN